MQIHKQGHSYRPVVLITDDDVVMRETLSAYLASFGFDCVTANDGVSASNKIESTHYALILLDLNMPGLQGDLVATAARKSLVNQKTPIAMITADGERGTLAKSFQAGATAYLQKPVSRQNIAQLLRTFGFATETPSQTAAPQQTESDEKGLWSRLMGSSRR